MQYCRSSGASSRPVSAFAAFEFSALLNGWRSARRITLRAIFSAAPQHLVDDGILVVEVGNTEAALMRAFPRLPFIWPEIAMGGGGVFVLRAQDLLRAQEFLRES